MFFILFLKKFIIHAAFCPREVCFMYIVIHQENLTNGVPLSFQESPFSNFLSNLSPIRPAKEPLVLQGFLGLNSPPLVFTSPHINALRETSFLKRFEKPLISDYWFQFDINCNLSIDDVTLHICYQVSVSSVTQCRTAPT